MDHLSKSYSLPLAMAVALLVAVGISGCAKKTETSVDIRPVRAIQVTAAPQQVLADYSGSVQPRIEAQIGFRVGGKISQRKVDVGTQVQAGQVLMQLNPEDLRLAQLQAEGNFRAAQANLELANNELKRYRELRKTNAVSQSMLDAKVSAASAAEGSFEQAKAQLKAQANQADYANLVATSSGVVTAINAEVGQVVSAGVPVVQIAQLGEMEVAVNVPENSVNVVSRANEIRIYLWANPQEAIVGKLRELSPIADPATRTFRAKVSLVNPSAKVAASIKMGMTANVQFAINTPSDYIQLPLSALFQDKGVTSVWVVDKEEVHLVPIQIGGANGNDLIVTAGLTPGQTVVTAGVHLLKPGQRVSILQENIVQENHSQPYISPQVLLKRTAPLDSAISANAGVAK